MATERQSPDGLLQQDNLSGVLSDIQDDPDSPDANWLEAIADGTDTKTRVSFPTPTGNPTQGANLQEFKIWIRKSRDKASTPDCQIDLYENGVLVTSGVLTGVTSITGELKSFNWDAVSLTNADGSGVEAYIYGKQSGGAPANRTTVEVGAVEWNVDYTTGGEFPYSGNIPIVNTLNYNSTVHMTYSGDIPIVTQPSYASILDRTYQGVIPLISLPNYISEFFKTYNGQVDIALTLTCVSGLFVEYEYAGILPIISLPSYISSMEKSYSGDIPLVATVSGIYSLEGANEFQYQGQIDVLMLPSYLSKIEMAYSGQVIIEILLSSFTEGDSKQETGLNIYMSEMTDENGGYLCSEGPIRKK